MLKMYSSSDTVLSISKVDGSDDTTTTVYKQTVRMKVYVSTDSVLLKPKWTVVMLKVYSCTDTVPLISKGGRNHGESVQ